MSTDCTHTRKPGQRQFGMLTKDVSGERASEENMRGTKMAEKINWRLGGLF